MHNEKNFFSHFMFQLFNQILNHLIILLILWWFFWWFFWIILLMILSIILLVNFLVVLLIILYHYFYKSQYKNDDLIKITQYNNEWYDFFTSSINNKGICNKNLPGYLLISPSIRFNSRIYHYFKLLIILFTYHWMILTLLQSHFLAVIKMTRSFD